MERVDNYQIQAAQAKQLFLQYDQSELIQRCALRFDADYFYITFLSESYRIHRHTGDMQRLHGDAWLDGNSFNEVMTILDWLCDSKPDRFLTGRWANLVSQGHSFHSNLQESEHDPHAILFDRNPDAFCRACEALGGRKYPSADISFCMELIDGVQVLVQLWRGDEEFAPRLRCLWEENTLMYLRYETTWYAQALLLHRIREQMK